MRTPRLATRLGLVLLAVLLSGVLLSQPSRADPKTLQVSTSAAGPWADALPTALFAGQGPVVPADVLPDRFFVRNGSDRPARATLAVVVRGPATELARRTSLSTEVGGVHGDIPVAVDPETTCKTYVTGPVVAPGAAQPVNVTLRVADLEKQVAMHDRLAVDLVLTLAQPGPAGEVDICGVEAVADGPGTSCPDPDVTVVTVLGAAACPQTAAAARPGALGDTGAPRGVATLTGLGLVLLTGGALLVARRVRPGGPRRPQPPVISR
jgi:hypothetical protein